MDPYSSPHIKIIVVSMFYSIPSCPANQRPGEHEACGLTDLARQFENPAFLPRDIAHLDT